jgi:1-phosphatidylinositol-4-phosphate 5-kinase
LEENESKKINKKDRFSLNTITDEEILDRTMSVNMQRNNSESLNKDLDQSLISEHTHVSKGNRYDAELIEYCPKLFFDLRKEESLDYKDLIDSLDPIKNKTNMLKIKQSSGKSGSFFFFSWDNRFIIKTVKDHELVTMLDTFMHKYYDHIIDHPDSFLTRIYGIYTIILG